MILPLPYQSHVIALQACWQAWYSIAKVKQAGLAALEIKWNELPKDYHQELTQEMVEDLRPGIRQELVFIIAEWEDIAAGWDGYEIDLQCVLHDQMDVWHITSVWPK